MIANNFDQHDVHLSEHYVENDDGVGDSFGKGIASLEVPDIIIAEIFRSKCDDRR